MSYRRRAYEYDNNGSLTKKVRTLADGTIITWTYAYDYENRLIRATKDSNGTVVKTVTFTYDPFGRRVGKKLERTKNGIPITKEYTYLYDNEDIIGEYFTKTKGTTVTTRTATYLHGPGIDEPLAMEKDGIKYYYHADGLGSITHLTDANQAEVESYTYNAFGKRTRYGNTIKNRYAFTGREWDRETNLYYYRIRYYDPRIGRFTTRDPIGFEDGVNFYLYVQNNPVNWVDPLGLEVIWPDPKRFIPSCPPGVYCVNPGTADPPYSNPWNPGPIPMPGWPPSGGEIFPFPPIPPSDVFPKPPTTPQPPGDGGGGGNQHEICD